MVKYCLCATAGFTGCEKTPVNQVLPLFQSQFTNISGESGLQTITPEYGDQQTDA